MKLIFTNQVSVMPDFADLASVREALDLSLALAVRAPEPVEPVGVCLYCQNEIPVGHFCETDCQHDHERIQAANRRNGVRAL